MLNDYPLPRSILLSGDVDFICLGHIRTHQPLHEKIAYSGSIERWTLEKKAKRIMIATNPKSNGSISAFQR
jgi:DNA repair exonuclease SbcCD nuclease subunit